LEVRVLREERHKQRFEDALVGFCSPEGTARVHRLIDLWKSLSGEIDYAPQMIPGVRGRLRSRSYDYSMWGAYVPEAGGKRDWKAPYFIVQFDNMVLAGFSWDRLKSFAERMRVIPWAGPLLADLEATGFKQKRSFEINWLPDAGVTEAIEDILRGVAGT
jgi:hypothetical protein